MVNKILVDTNVLLDSFQERQSYYEEAKLIISACAEGKLEGCIAAHSITNIFFILRKDYSISDRRFILRNICTIFDVEGIDRSKLISGLENERDGVYGE